MKRGRRALNGLDDEIRDHIERETRENIDRGIAPEEARRLALVQFGNVALRAVLGATRRTIASVAPDVVVRKATTMREVLDASIGPAREEVPRPAPGVESHRGD